MDPSVDTLEARNLGQPESTKTKAAVRGLDQDVSSWRLSDGHCTLNEGGGSSLSSPRNHEHIALLGRCLTGTQKGWAPLGFGRLHSRQSYTCYRWTLAGSVSIDLNTDGTGKGTDF